MAVAAVPGAAGGLESLAPHDDISLREVAGAVRSPRCEAFVMTGDKILNLNPNISPSYAKVAREQLPPGMAVHEPPRAAALFNPFPSQRRGRLQPSFSHPEGVSVNAEAARQEENKDNEQHKNQEVPSLMMTSVMSNAFSNPQISSRPERTNSSETFIVGPASPSKMSNVTVNAIMSTPTTRQSPRVSSHRVNRIPSTTESMLHCVFAPWGGMRVDAALREFLSHVQLKGETSERERLLNSFSTRYHNANPALFASQDEVHALACGLLLLNSDLHMMDSKKKMTMREFVVNMGHTGHNYPATLLKTLYQNIKEAPLMYTGIPSTAGTPKRRHPSNASSEAAYLADPESQVEYKRGFLMRKVVYDNDGTLTPRGRRGWQMLFVRLRGLALYFSRDETEPRRFEALSKALLLHHALAESATDYVKRKHVFRVRTAGLGEVLFQTSSDSEVESWLSSINFVCACFSSRSLPPALSSSGLLTCSKHPRLPSCAPLHEQLVAHENAIQALSSELTRVQQNAPPLKSKGRVVELYFFNEALLSQELKRYKVYCAILRSRLHSHSSDSGIQSKASNDGPATEEDRISYREAMHLQ